MPYIKQADRVYPDEAMDAAYWGLGDPGCLNYLITGLCRIHIEKNGGRCYKNFNEVMGVLECVKQEFYRRAVAPYEDCKIRENGDVF